MGELSDYQFWLSQGLCPDCHKRKPAPGRHACRQCLDKRNAYVKARQTSYYKNLPDERKQAIKDREKAEYQRHKRLGLCVSCTKKATHGIFCEEHWLKMKDARTKHNRKVGHKEATKRQKLKMPKVGKQAHIDVGKLIALYNAGWTYKQIEEEMKINERSISYWVRKAKDATNAEKEGTK